MIQSPSPLRSAAAAGAESRQPASARAVPGQAQGDTVPGFSERMRFAGEDGAASSTGLPAPSLLSVLPVEVAEPAAMPTEGKPQAEVAELGLLEIIEQQLAEFDAREAAQADPLPVVPVVPAPSPVPQIERIEERLGWLSQPMPFAPGAHSASRQVEPLETMGASDWSSRAAETNPVTAANARFGEFKNTVRAPADMSGGSVQLQAQALPLSTQASFVVDAPSSLPGEPLDAAEALISTERGQAASSQATDRTLRLQAPEAKWGEQMLHALRENVELQIQQKIQSATIRLDPPELGSLEILLSHESGRLSVQLTAANADVARLLQQSSERLRHELVGQNFGQVSVQVGADSGGQQGQQRQRAALAAEESPLAARTLDEEAQNSRAAERARDVLVTV